MVDPEPFSDAEDKASEYGLTAVPLGTSGDKLYFGLVGSNSTDGESVMPFIQPSKESFLEYDVARIITTLSNPGKPVLEAPLCDNARSVRQRADISAQT